MADTTRKVGYWSVTVDDKPGEGARVLGTLKQKGVNLLAFHAFPAGGKSQLDFVPADEAAFTKAAQGAGWKLSGRKEAFLVQGDDRAGVVADVLGKLGSAGINVTAVDAVCGGQGRYGALLWVKPADVARAAKALGAA